MVRSGKGEWNTAELFKMAKVVNPKMVRKEIRWSLMLHWIDQQHQRNNTYYFVV